MSKLPCVDLVIPVYNEEEGIAAFHSQLSAEIAGLDATFNLYYINDGSNDATQACLEKIAENDRRVCLLELSRNFGHQAALTAGLDHAHGDYVITLDGDGQHPPRLIGQMLQLALAGYDLVLTQRIESETLSVFKRATSGLFYRLINRISDTQILPGGADFRLMKQSVVSEMRNMREQHRFLRGMVGWMGYRSVILPYQQPERMAGKSKYSLQKMLNLSINAIFSFSLVPLYVVLSLGVLFLLLAGLEVVYVLSQWLLHADTLVRGWSSLMFVLLFTGGMLMMALGFIGVYVGLIFQEVKRRPLYLVRRKEGKENCD